MRQANYLNSHNSFLLSVAASNSFHIIHLSPSPQEASSSSPNCSLLLLPNCLQSLIRSCSGFHASILWPLGCSLSDSSAPLLLLAGKKAQQQKQALYQSFPGDLQLLRNPSGQTTFFVNILVANTRAAQRLFMFVATLWPAW